MPILTPEDQKQIDNWFNYHSPKPEDLIGYQAVREAAKYLAVSIMLNCPPSADRTAAIRKIREAVMTANASIACGGA